MPIAAHSTAEPSTLAVLAGIAILISALASACILLNWLSREARRHLQRRRPGRSTQALINRAGSRPGGAENVVAPGLSHTSVSDTALANQRNPDPSSDGRSSGARPNSPGDARVSAGSGSPVILGTRCAAATLEPLAENLDTSHRLAVAEARVASTLTALAADRWLVERYVLIAGHRIPFLILGERGVFTVWALSGPPIWRELPIPGHVAVHVKQALPGYAGPVQVGICRALAPAGIEPRWWCRPGEPGAWVMGPDWLIGWIEHYGPEHGLGVEDLERLRELSKPKPGPAPRVPDVVPDLSPRTPTRPRRV